MEIFGRDLMWYTYRILYNIVYIYHHIISISLIYIYIITKTIWVFGCWGFLFLFAWVCREPGLSFWHSTISGVSWNGDAVQMDVFLSMFFWWKILRKYEWTGVQTSISPFLARNWTQFTQMSALFDTPTVTWPGYPPFWDKPMCRCWSMLVVYPIVPWYPNHIPLYPNYTPWNLYKIWI
jgi:hypothetical protein